MRTFFDWSRMAMSHRKLLLVLATSSALFLAACGGTESSSEGQSATPTQSASQDASTDSSSPTQQLSGSLTFVNFGGDTMTAAKKGWLEPFTQETGVTFTTDEPGDQAKVKAMVESGRTTWDVIDYDPSAAGPECGTLYEERPSWFDTSELDPGSITDDCMVPILGQTVALVYNKALFGDAPPTSIADFLDTEKFPGQRITFNYWAGTAEPMLLAAGVEADSVYPYDWSILNSVVDQLGGDLTFQSTIDQQVQAQESGDFAMCLCYLGRSAVAAQNGAEIGVVWDKIWTGFDGLYAIKGSQNPDAQWAFIQKIATSAGQSPLSLYVAYGPMTTGQFDAPAEFQPFLPGFNQNQISQSLLADVPYLSENAAELSDQWAALTAG